MLNTTHFQVVTRVSGEVGEVFAQMELPLLLKLVPPGMQVEVVRFDQPYRVGGIVHLRAKVLGLATQEWYNEITEVECAPQQCHFTDEGRRMPKMLHHWRHRHIVRAGAKGTEIVDDVTFAGRNRVMTWVLFPVVWGQFLWRKPIYRKYFRK